MESLLHVWQWDRSIVFKGADARMETDFFVNSGFTTY